MPYGFFISVFQRLEHRLKELEGQKTAAASEKQQLQDECQQLIQRKTKLELDIRDLETSVTEDASAKVTSLTVIDTAEIRV